MSYRFKKSDKDAPVKFLGFNGKEYVGRIMQVRQGTIVVEYAVPNHDPQCHAFLNQEQARERVSFI